MWFPGNAQALGRRGEQQDAFAFSDLADAGFVAQSGALCVVCDGMGGHAAGGEAARAAVAGFLAAYRGRDPGETIGQSLQRAADAANEAVLEVASAAGDAGSTLAAAVVHAGALHWLGIGDSWLLLRRGGRLVRINREHSYRGELLRRAADGDLPWHEAMADPLGERLTASLGEASLPAADRSRRGFPLRPGDQVYLATDGLYRSASLAALEAAAPPEALPDTVCAAWVALALAAERPDQDNVTVAGLAWPAPPAQADAQADAEEAADWPTAPPASIGPPAGTGGFPRPAPVSGPAAARAASTRAAAWGVAAMAVAAGAWLAWTPTAEQRPSPAADDTDRAPASSPRLDTTRRAAAAAPAERVPDGAPAAPPRSTPATDSTPAKPAAAVGSERPSPPAPRAASSEGAR